MTTDPIVVNEGHPMKDSEGRDARLSLINHHGDNIYGAYARCPRILDNVELLLNDEA